MPIHEYECQVCGNVDELITIKYDSPEVAECSECGNRSKKIISAGAIHTDTPNWIDESVRGALEGDGERPIRTRKDLDRKLKEIKAEPIEKGHRNLRMI